VQDNKNTTAAKYAYRIELEKFISALSTRFINIQTDNIQKAINQELRWLGEYIGVTVCRLYTVTGSMLNLYSCWPDGKKTSFWPSRIKVHSFIWNIFKHKEPWIYHFPGNKITPSAVTTALPVYQKGSAVIIPMFFNNKPNGLLVLASPNTDCDFNKRTVMLLQTAGEIFIDAVERMKNNKIIEQERFLLRALMDTYTDRIYFKDLKSRHTRVNKSWCKLHRITDESLAIGKSDFDFFSKKDAEEAYADEQKIIRTGVPLLNKIEKKIADTGKKRATLVSKMPLRDANGQIVGTFGISRDITELMNTREAIEYERNQLNTLIDNLPDSIYIKDTHSRFVRNNRHHLDVLGVVNQEEVLNKTDKDFFPKELAEKYFTDEQNIISTGVPIYDKIEPVIEYTKRKKLKKWYATTKVPIRDSENHISGLIGIGRDITDRVISEQKLKQSHENLRKMLCDIIETMARIVETRDPYTSGHQQRVAQLSSAIAAEMGIPDEEIYYIHMAAQVHDIGKMSVPAEILSKTAKLNDAEFSLIKFHTVQGYEILKQIDFPYPIADIVHQHHERIDGKGYPQGLKGRKIHTAAKIIAVADTLEAIANHRPYRPGFGTAFAVKQIIAAAGTHLDPASVKICAGLFRKKKFTFI